MLVLILVFGYITFICDCWGRMTVDLLKRFVPETQINHDRIIFWFIGLSTISVILGFLSLIIPLGSVWIHLPFIISSLFYVNHKKPKLKTYLSILKNTHTSVYFLAAALIIMICTMSVWKIEHPDTLGYHIQTIKWIQEYKIIPGLVHLNERLGYQGMWFVLCAFFNLSFLESHALTFLNCSVLIWFILFCISKINLSESCLSNHKRIQNFLIIIVLIISTWSFTQIRLTAISTSPDFIAVIYAFLSFYLFIVNRRYLTRLVVCLLSLSAVTIKLSVAPLLLLPTYCFIYFITRKKFRLTVLSTFIFISFLAPFLLRNIITSGYLIFPLPYSNVINTDWAYNQEKTIAEKAYIKAYARIPKDYDSEAEVLYIAHANLKKWLPRWWHSKSTADKTVLTLFFLSLVHCILFFRRMLNTPEVRIVFILALTGTLFWLMNAPDPRFGFAFLMPVIILSFKQILKIITCQNIKYYKAFFLFLVISFAVTISLYNVYRFMNFFSLPALIQPLGVTEVETRSIVCDKQLFNIPKSHYCSASPLPCTTLDCNGIKMRGNKLTDGFVSPDSK